MDREKRAMDKNKIKAFADHVVGDMGSAMGAGLAYVGTKVGLFRAMAGGGPVTPEVLATKTGLQKRYVTEWLKGMVCAKYLDYDPETQTYELPDEHAYLVASEGTDHYVGGLFYSVPMMLGMAPRVADAFIHGGGVPFSDYGSEGVLAIDLMNRGLYEKRLANYWLTTCPATHERLIAGGHVLDFGCGSGRVSIALAKDFPKSSFIGIDTDSASIAAATETALQENLTKQVRFECGTTEVLPTDEYYDLITICDCIHDLSDPLGILTTLRPLLTKGGILFIIEPKAADKLEDNIHSVGAMYYGMSVFHCMTQSLASGGPGLGTCMGPASMEALTREAGFGHFEILDIKSQTNIFYAVSL